MGIVVAALFGLSIGTLIGFETLPRMRWLPYLSAVVLLAIGVSFATWGPYASPAYGFVIAGAGILALILVACTAWRDHPFLEGMGYWSRVWFVFWHTPTLARALRDAKREGE